MGLLSALRDRLFGPPTAPSVPDEATADPAAASSSTVVAPSGPVEPVADQVEAPASAAQTASVDTSASDQMPTRQPSEPSDPSGNGDNAEAGDGDAVVARQERVAGRILEDERLRGDLTDDEFQPLLDWAMTAADQLAASTAGLSDEQAERRIDGGIQAIREAVAAAGDAITAYTEHDLDRLRQALADAGIGAGDPRADPTITRMTTDRNLPGSVVAALIASRLPSVTPDESNRIRKGSS